MTAAQQLAATIIGAMIGMLIYHFMGLLPAVREVRKLRGLPHAEIIGVALELDEPAEDIFPEVPGHYYVVLSIPYGTDYSNGLIAEMET